jgi:hypothetical protein
MRLRDGVLLDLLPDVLDVGVAGPVVLPVGTMPEVMADVVAGERVTRPAGRASRRKSSGVSATT